MSDRRKHLPKSVPFDDGFKERLKDPEYAYDVIQALAQEYEAEIARIRSAEIPPLLLLVERAETLLKDCMNGECTSSMAHMWLLHKRTVFAMRPVETRTPTTTPKSEGSEDRG